MRFRLQNAFLRPKVVFEQNFHFFGSDRARRRKWVRVCEFVRVPKSTFCSKSQFCSKSYFFIKNQFSLQKLIFSPKSDFGAKRANFAILTKIDSIWPLFLHCLVQNGKMMILWQISLFSYFASKTCSVFFKFEIFCNFYKNFTFLTRHFYLQRCGKVC